MTQTLPQHLEFLLHHPLYDERAFGTNDLANLFFNPLMTDDINYDWHCSGCNSMSVFHILKQKSNSPAVGPYTLHMLIAECTRNKSHTHLFYVLRVRAGGLTTLIKIGQYPSLADLAQAENNKYRIVLEKNKFKELSRGIGLAAHGIGIGAFVYLRRVFESLIENAHLEAKTDSQWNENKYKESRMDEKIKQLKEYLPEFLVKHSSIYGILSKGIHELEEEECLSIFPAIKTAIELILDEKIRAKELAEKEKNAARAISNVQSQLKKT